MIKLYLIFLFLALLIFILLKLVGQLKFKRTDKVIAWNEITILVPFRNEVKNLPLFLESLLRQKNKPYEIIFIDDHSEDTSASLVKNFIKENNVGELVALGSNQKGKKEALLQGVKSANSKYILTLDADVILDDEYLTALSNYPAFDLISLPVIAKGTTFLSKLFATEYMFFNAFNFLTSSLFPISVSGANLLFNTEALDYQQQLKGHIHHASGDDYFLLKSYRRNRSSIVFENRKELSVTTPSPSSLKDYLKQRLRWLEKTRSSISFWEIVIGTFIALYWLGGFIALLLALFSGQWLLFLSVLSIRLFLDGMIYSNYTQRLQIKLNFLYLFLFQVLYPVMLVVVFVLSLGYKPEWKGRRQK